MEQEELTKRLRKAAAGIELYLAGGMSKELVPALGVELKIIGDTLVACARPQESPRTD